jgi:hypothetical protein
MVEQTVSSSGYMQLTVSSVRGAEQTISSSCCMQQIVSSVHGVEQIGVTAVAQKAKAPGIYCCVAGSIPAFTPR